MYPIRRYACLVDCRDVSILVFERHFCCSSRHVLGMRRNLGAWERLVLAFDLAIKIYLVLALTVWLVRKFSAHTFHART